MEVPAVIATHQAGFSVSQSEGGTALPWRGDAALWRVRLPGSASVQEVLAVVEDDPYRCSLIGAWAGGGAIVASDPLRVAEPDEDPFALLTQMPSVPGLSELSQVSAGGAVGPSGAVGASGTSGAVGASGTSGAVGAVGGGWFGWLGYRLAQRLEDIPLAADRPVPLPDFHLAYYDNVLRRDRAGVWWFEALATPERYGELEERLGRIRLSLRPRQAGSSAVDGNNRRTVHAAPLRLSQDAAARHLRAVAECRERIAAGEIFQANICLRLESEYDGDAIDLLATALRICSEEETASAVAIRSESSAPPLHDSAPPLHGPAPWLHDSASSLHDSAPWLHDSAPWLHDSAPLLYESADSLPQFTAAFDTPAGGILSLSPELFLRRSGRQVRTGPIKGTVARGRDPEQAEAALAALRASSKNAAEHVMIVDLMRNDLGRVCEYGSVSAPRHPTAEAQPGLWHLVTHVDGTVRPQTSDADLLRATFPPGSVTGAPKVQSLIVISELESSGREVYTGAVGYASPVRGLELNVAIRTLELADGKLWLGVGGGIVADSDPVAELEETLVKARPVAAAIGTTLAPTPPYPDDPARPTHAGDPARPTHAGEPARPTHAGDPARPTQPAPPTPPTSHDRR